MPSHNTTSSQVAKKPQADMRLAKEFLSYITEQGDEPIAVVRNL